MSRSSPGRYALHDFAKNVYDVRAFARDGRELPAARPDASGWTVAGHGGAVTVRYKVYGDRVDGTYLAVDTTHAHINMPAAIMWARGLDDRPATITFEPPTGTAWRVATQLHAASSPLEFTAPNLQYLMDSPVEFGPVIMRQFAVGQRVFRFALHQAGAENDLVEGFLRDVEAIVRQEGAIFGEYPDFEPGHYTFLADYLPYASGDGMEHRNSTVMTSSGSIARSRTDLLETVAHEFFHAWNVERIRPRDLEPFDLDGNNPSGSLWLAEGFTQYYGPLAMRRAGLVDTVWLARTFEGLIASTATPGLRVRSAEEMSRMASFTDGARPADRTNWSITVTSYYPLGGAIALALDLTLRDRSDGRIGLDDYMRAMWRRHGKPGGTREGYVDRPYTAADAEAVLAEVSGDPAFAREFFGRYIQGHDVADYQRLLARAGLLLRPVRAGAAWLGDLRLDARNGRARVAAPVAPTWPIYAAGLDEDDEIQLFGGDRIASIGDLNAVLRRHKPGDRVAIIFVDRGGVSRTASVTLGEDPRQEVVPVEAAGGAPTSAELGFRDQWLGPR
jgi:predicted metalloprotease with PDZ domain